MRWEHLLKRCISSHDWLPAYANSALPGLCSKAACCQCTMLCFPAHQGKQHFFMLSIVLAVMECCKHVGIINLWFTTIPCAGETVWGDEVLVLVLGQLLPPAPVAGGATSNSSNNKQPAATRRTTYISDVTTEEPAESVITPAVPPTGGPAAVFQVMVRSAQPGVVRAIAQDPATWLHDLSAGSLQVMGGGLGRARVHGASAPRPALHPRVAALHATFAHGVRALPGPTASILQGAAGDGTGHAAGAGGSHGGAGAGGAVTGVGGVDVYAQGSLAAAKVSHKWMEAAALAEWQRLVASRS